MSSFAGLPMGVRIEPGRIVFTRIRAGPNSIAATLVSPRIAHLEET